MLKQHFKDGKKYFKMLTDANCLKFQGLPVDYKNNTIGKSRFQTWTKRQKGDDFYQGEVNREGKRDGKGIYLRPGTCLGIGY